MPKLLCHWTRQEARKMASALYEADIYIDHTILLDWLNPENRPFDDPVEDMMEGLELQELQVIFGKKKGDTLYNCGQDLDCFIDTLQGIGGYLVLGSFRPPDEDEIRFDEQGEIIGYGLACFSRPILAWAPCLPTAMGKCLAAAAKEKRIILHEARQKWQQQQGA